MKFWVLLLAVSRPFPLLQFTQNASCQQQQIPEKLSLASRSRASLHRRLLPRSLSEIESRREELSTIPDSGIVSERQQHLGISEANLSPKITVTVSEKRKRAEERSTEEELEEIKCDEADVATDKLIICEMIKRKSTGEVGKFPESLSTDKLGSVVRYKRKVKRKNGSKDESLDADERRSKKAKRVKNEENAQDEDDVSQEKRKKEKSDDDTTFWKAPKKRALDSDEHTRRKRKNDGDDAETRREERKEEIAAATKNGTKKPADGANGSKKAADGNGAKTQKNHKASTIAGASIGGVLAVAIFIIGAIFMGKNPFKAGPNQANNLLAGAADTQMQIAAQAQNIMPNVVQAPIVQQIDDYDQIQEDEILADQRRRQSISRRFSNVTRPPPNQRRMSNTRRRLPSITDQNRRRSSAMRS